MRTKFAIGVFLLPVLAPWQAHADCKCIANGHVFRHGEVACLRLPSGPQLARCGMVLNNSSWIKLQDGCPVASATEQRVAGHGPRRVSSERLCPRDVSSG